MELSREEWWLILAAVTAAKNKLKNRTERREALTALQKKLKAEQKRLSLIEAEKLGL